MQTVAAYTWSTADNFPARDPVSWAVDYSTDCVNWVGAVDVRTRQAIPQGRGTWAGQWWLSTSCYVNPNGAGCGGYCLS
jgi:hypothetical protein